MRHKVFQLEAAIDRADRDRPQGVARFLGQIYSGGAIPTAVPRVFMARPLSLSASESEGASATLTPDTTRSVPVLVIGPGVPAAGDRVTAVQHEGRWVAGYGTASSGPAPVMLPGCGCNPIPAVLDLVDTRVPWPCQGNTSFPFFPDDTITYQTIPPGYGAASGTQRFFGDHDHVDSFGEVFRWLINCNVNFFQLLRIYSNFAGGGPFTDAVRFTWPHSSNSCSPFAYTVGTIYSGGNTLCNNRVHLLDAT